MENYDGNTLDLLKSFIRNDDPRHKAEILAQNVYDLLFSTLQRLENHGSKLTTNCVQEM